MFRYPVSWTRVTGLTLLLAPFSWLYGAAVAVRRWLYRALPSRSVRLPVAVIVVGNISVGGTGKTPLVLWLAARLREAGYQPGIISRGYGSHGGHGGKTKVPRAVHAQDDPALCGDEPVLLARRSGCPVWISAQRVNAARALLAAHPQCNVIISDDGLQHYALARDVEIAVLDTTRGDAGLGNGWLLPAGPLREPPARLTRVDAIVLRGHSEPLAAATPPRYSMTLAPTGFYPLRDPARRVEAQHFQGQRVHAVAGIGNPQQFFDSLTRMGVVHVPHAFPDHHRYTAADITFADADAVVMTEKDAVKCERFAADGHWALQADAQIGGGLLQPILEQLERLERLERLSRKR